MAWNFNEDASLDELQHPLDAEELPVDGEFDGEDYAYYDEEDFDYIGSDYGE